jgi:hypothetical protein
MIFDGICNNSARVGTPIDPGFGFQRSTAKAEVLARVGLIVKIIILLPFCLTLSAVGIIIIQPPLYVVHANVSIV